MNHYEHSRLALAQRIAAFLTLRRKPATDLAPLVSTGLQRAAATAKYMAEQASSLRMAWENAEDRGDLFEAATFQAGAAAAEAMSEMLLAAVANDAVGLRKAFVAFVNDAVDTGVVTV